MGDETNPVFGGDNSALPSGDRQIQIGLWQFLEQVMIAHVAAPPSAFAPVMASLSGLCGSISDVELDAYARAYALDADVRERMGRWLVAHNKVSAAREASRKARSS